MNLLVVGSGLEARLALHKLAASSGSGKLYHLPSPVPFADRYQGVPSTLLPGLSPVETTRLTDVWGKTLLSLNLPSLGILDAEESWKPEGEIESLPAGVQVKRTATTENGYLVTLSDGSELVVAGVLFADGSESQAKLFWTKPSVSKADKTVVRCWSFETQNFLNIENWEFRWAAAKSVELLALEGDRVLVKLRFRSPFGGDLSVSELRELYSEFGSDMTALFENLQEEMLHGREERPIENPVFHPAPGCIALGRAAWNPPTFLTWGWLAQFVERQLNLVREQLQKESLSPESFEAQCCEMMGELMSAEEFVRKQLHLDNPFLRSFRGLLMTVLPKSFLASKIRARMGL